jgi:hypothetical protein
MFKFFSNWLSLLFPNEKFCSRIGLSRQAVPLKEERQRPKNCQHEKLNR